MKVNSNIQAMVAQGILHKNEKKYQSATEKLSSGYKINTAIDNPSGMAITNKMHAQLKSLKKATQNTNNGISVCQTADGALSEIHNMLQRLNELGVQASNGTLTSEDRLAIQEEVVQLTSEIARIGSSTEFNTQPLFDGSQDLKGYTDNSQMSVLNYNSKFPQRDDYKINVKILSDKTAEATITPDKTDHKAKSEVFFKRDEVTGELTDEISFVRTTFSTSDGGELTVDTKPGGSTEIEANVKVEGIGGMKIQSGTMEHQEIQVIIPSVSLKHLGLADLDGNLTIDMRTQEDARSSLDQIKDAISYISKARSQIGSYQNRLEANAANLQVTEENLTNSYSTIKDLDMAEEMVNYTTLQVLVQAGTSMLTQANEQPQQALQLLQ